MAGLLLGAVGSYTGSARNENGDCMSRLIRSLRRLAPLCCILLLAIVGEGLAQVLIPETLTVHFHGKDAPDGRPIEPPTLGKVFSLPRVGGLHHRYTRIAA